MDGDSSTPVAATSDAEVFGSPPEPIFNDSRRGINAELLQESLQSLTNTNSAALAAHNVADTDCSIDSFRSGNAVAFIFSLCRHYGLADDVRYRSVELFHRFMCQHIEEVYDHVQSTQDKESPISWEAVEDRLKYQVTLRALTCVQLSSKMSLHYKIVGVAKAKSFMTRCGYRFAASSLVQSEIRVLKTLKYCVSGPTPLDYVELLTEIVGKTDTVPVKQLHGVCLKVLDTFYYCREDIIKRISKLASSIDPYQPVIINEDNLRTAALGMNYMLSAASVVGAAAFVLCPANSDYIVDLVTSKVPSIPKKDILDLSTLLIEQIMLDPPV